MKCSNIYVSVMAEKVFDGNASHNSFVPKQDKLVTDSRCIQVFIAEHTQQQLGVIIRYYRFDFNVALSIK